MPFKGDENMLVDAKDRKTLDDDEGENQLLFGFDEPAKNTGGATQPTNNTGGVLDLDLMLGGTPAQPDANAQNTNNNLIGDMMDLFGGPT